MWAHHCRYQPSTFSWSHTRLGYVWKSSSSFEPRSVVEYFIDAVCYSYPSNQPPSRWDVHIHKCVTHVHCYRQKLTTLIYSTRRPISCKVCVTLGMCSSILTSAFQVKENYEADVPQGWLARDHDDWVRSNIMIKGLAKVRMAFFWNTYTWLNETAHERNRHSGPLC